MFFFYLFLFVVCIIRIFLCKEIDLNLLFWTLDWLKLNWQRLLHGTLSRCLRLRLAQMGHLKGNFTPILKYSCTLDVRESYENPIVARTFK